MERIRWLLLCLIILLFCGGFAGANEKQTISDIVLTDQFGENFAMEAVRGKTTLVLFGYTSCPDVCPMGLTHISTILKELGPDSEDLVAIFISVDPSRDTPDVLRSYVSWFHQDIVGLTGSTTEINAVTRAFNVQYSLNRKSSLDNNYTVDHSSGFYLLDNKAKLTQIVPFGLPIEHTIESIRALISKTKSLAKRS